MKFILIGVVGFTAVVLLEALVYTLRFLGDREKDELKRRLSNLGSGTGAAADRRSFGWASWPSNPAIDAMLRSLKSRRGSRACSSRPSWR